MASNKYLENWVSGVYYGYSVQRLRIDNNFEIILESTRNKPNQYTAKLKDGRAVVTKFTLSDMPDSDTAKLNAIRKSSEYLHAASQRFTFASINLRTLTGVCMAD